MKMTQADIVASMSDTSLARAAHSLTPEVMASVMRSAALDDEIADLILPSVLGEALEAGEISINKRDIIADPNKAKAPLRSGRGSATTPVVNTKPVARQFRKAPAKEKVASTPKAAKPVSATKAKGVKRTPDVMAQLMDMVHEHVRENPGQGVEQIGKALGQKTKELTRPIANLLENKRIHSKGQKRATRYFPGAAE